MSNITNEIIAAYLGSLYSCDNEKLNELRAFAEEKKVPIILKDTEGLILSLLKIKAPEHILEIGTAIGYSSCCFADACGCHITTIESDEKAHKIAVDNVKNLGFDGQVQVLFGDAREVLQELSATRAKSAKANNSDDAGFFDVVFIDAAKSHYKSFWDLAIPLCRDEALVICDNVLMKGMTASDEYDPNKKYKTSIRRMREFIDYITKLDYAETCILPVGDGVSLSIVDKLKMAGTAKADQKEENRQTNI